ncbi:hypothetical protein ACQP2K_39775 [Microbispora siamensis]
MRKGIGYADAVRLLGQESKVAKALEPGLPAGRVRRAGRSERGMVVGPEGAGWDEEGPLPDFHTLDVVHFLGDPELDGLALAAEPAIMAADLRSAAQLFSHSEEAVEHLANAWRLTGGMRETIEATIADLRDEYRNDPERVAAAFRRATGSELPDAVVEPDRSEGAHPGRNDATGRG